MRHHDARPTDEELAAERVALARARVMLAIRALPLRAKRASSPRAWFRHHPVLTCGALFGAVAGVAGVILGRGRRGPGVDRGPAANEAVAVHAWRALRRVGIDLAGKLARNVLGAAAVRAVWGSVALPPTEAVDSAD